MIFFNYGLSLVKKDTETLDLVSVSPWILELNLVSDKEKLDSLVLDSSR